MAEPPRVFVAGLVRDAETSVDEILGFVDALHDTLPSTSAYIFENNSRDRTAELLRAGAEARPHLSFCSETWDLDAFRDAGRARTWDNKPCRLELIAAARNKLLDWLRASGLAPEDVVVMIDWDFAAAPAPELVVRWATNMPDDADALFANGTDGAGRYYDLYEIRTAEHPLGPELLGDGFWSSRRRARDLRRVIAPDEPPIECYSAFGGMAIYRAGALDGCRYSPYPTPELHEFYRERFAADPDNPEIRSVRRAKVEKVWDGALLGVYLFDGELFYRNNSGFNFPIAAEHVNLHLAMRARGRGRFRIVPSLRYRSTH